MGSVGLPELLVIFTIALIIFGPRKLPEIGKTLGKTLAEFKRATNELRNTLDEEIRAEERRAPPPPHAPRAIEAARPIEPLHQVEPLPPAEPLQPAEHVHDEPTPVEPAHTEQLGSVPRQNGSA